jgi:hypothetical protein
VRRLDQRYGADTLLQRTICTQFEQIDGRQLWLPRRIETQLFEWFTAPGTAFKDAFLSEIAMISSYDGRPVPEETFRLNYTTPGTVVTDGTDPASAKLKSGHVNYTIPAQVAELPAVIERARKGENMLAGAGGMSISGAPLGIVPLSEGYRRGAMLTIVLFNVAAVAGGAVYLGWRWRNRGET